MDQVPVVSNIPKKTASSKDNFKANKQTFHIDFVLEVNVEESTEPEVAMDQPPVFKSPEDTASLKVDSGAPGVADLNSTFDEIDEKSTEPKAKISEADNISTDKMDGEHESNGMDIDDTDYGPFETIDQLSRSHEKILYIVGCIKETVNELIKSKWTSRTTQTDFSILTTADGETKVNPKASLGGVILEESKIVELVNLSSNDILWKKQQKLQERFEKLLIKIRKVSHKMSMYKQLTTDLNVVEPYNQDEIDEVERKLLTRMSCAERELELFELQLQEFGLNDKWCARRSEEGMLKWSNGITELTDSLDAITADMPSFLPDNRPPPVNQPENRNASRTLNGVVYPLSEKDIRRKLEMDFERAKLADAATRAPNRNRNVEMNGDMDGEVYIIRSDELDREIRALFAGVV